VILLSSPVPKTTKKVIGEETVNGIPDDVYIDRLFYPKPEKETKRMNTESITNLISLSWTRSDQIHSDK